MPETRRILFVDDEPRVLDGLRRMLYSMRHEWKMSFVESGQDALLVMATEVFDVIVTDMRMPGMSGVELLNEVRKLHPQTVRIVLSGQTKRETIIRSIAPIHQFLSKPCDAATMKSTLIRAFALRELLTESGLQQLVSQIESLPSLPSVYYEILEALQSDDVSTGLVGEIISKDMGMSAKILQLVNSAFFGLPRHVSDPAQAVIYLGLETVKSLVLSVHLFSQFDQSKCGVISFDTLWRHSLAVGGCAKAIAKSEGLAKMEIDDAFMAGLLHDIGKIVLAINFPQKYKLALELTEKQALTIHEAEHEMFGSGHGEVGAYLLGLWGLPDSLIMASAFHHSPANYPQKRLNPIAIVYVANILEIQENPKRWMGALPKIDQDYLSELGLKARLPQWKKIFNETIKKGSVQ